MSNIRCIYEVKAYTGSVYAPSSSRTVSISTEVIEFTTLQKYKEFKEKYIDTSEYRELLIIDNGGNDV